MVKDLNSVYMIKLTSASSICRIYIYSYIHKLFIPFWKLILLHVPFHEGILKKTGTLSPFSSCARSLAYVNTSDKVGQVNKEELHAT